MNTARFIARRLLQVLPVVLAIAAMNFLLLQLAPGDAADILAGQMGHASPELVEQMRRDFGLDRPIYQQFFIYLGKLLSLNLGTSNIQQRPVTDLIMERLPATVLLMTTATVVAVALGVLLGVAAARRSGRWLDSVISVVALAVDETPTI